MILLAYANSGQNLRGRSFKGQNLAGANFCNADIRGADFTGANLKDANFSGVLGGIPRKWLITLIAISHSLTILSTLSSISIITIIRSWISNDFFESNLTLITLCTVIIFALMIIAAKNFFLKTILFITIITIIICGIIVAISNSILVWYQINIVSFAKALVGYLIVTTTCIVGIAFSIVLIKILSEKYYPLVTASAFRVGFLGTIFRIALRGGSAVLFTDLIINPIWHWAWIDILWGSIWSWSITIIGNYIGLLSFHGHKELTLIRKIAIVLSTIGSTKFYQSNLQNINFKKAILKSTDFRFSNLKGACFVQTKQLHLARVGNSYLQYPQIRQLILTGQGKNKNFDRLDLRGINLKSAILTDASFIGTDLSEACFQDADLSRAKLVKTQVDRTDFTGATLTGAYIQDWNITHETNFRGVKCDYVYMRLPTKENPNPLRKPDNNAEVFADGEFGYFIQPIFDTLDLYHNQGVDPRAIAISFKDLAEKYPDAELEIMAMEKRGEDKFLLRVKTAPEADKSELSAEYFDTYNLIKGLPEPEIKLILAEKDDRIRCLENMVLTALKTPSYYSNTQVEQLRTMTNNPGGNSQNMSGGNMYGGMQAARDNSNQQMEANVNQASEKQLTQADVIQMLAQIEDYVNSTSELPQADKEKSLRYLGAAKEETQSPEADKQLAAGNLKRMAQTIETTSKTVESGKALWVNVKPILKELPAYFGVAATFFGL